MAGNYGVIRGSLAITAGRAPTTGEMFNTANIVPFLLTSLLVGVITSIGSILCYLPGIVATFFLIFAPYYAADKGMGAVDSIKASVAAVQNNLGNMAAFFGLSILAYIAGAIVCGIGLLVAVPVIMLSSAYMYRSINGEPIAP